MDVGACFGRRRWGNYSTNRNAVLGQVGRVIGGGQEIWGIGGLDIVAEV